jgi:hypothetical protein
MQSDSSIKLFRFVILQNFNQLSLKNILSRGFIVFGFLFLSHSSFASSENEAASIVNIVKESFVIDSLAQNIYHDLETDELPYPVFLSAFNGYYQFQKNGIIENKDVLTIIDFDKTSDKKRIYIIDIDKHQILYHSYVAHGQQTGELEAKDFSNRENSHQSSLGFYLTDNTYFGKHGLSLRLDGLSKGLNDNARKRNIVVHSADYVSEDYIKRNKRLGRSWGCPALPAEGYEEVIELIKDRSLLYIYSSKAYASL